MVVHWVGSFFSNYRLLVHFSFSFFPLFQATVHTKQEKKLSGKVHIV